MEGGNPSAEKQSFYSPCRLDNIFNLGFFLIFAYEEIFVDKFSYKFYYDERININFFAFYLFL